jgi:hypothetical protein
MADRSVGSERLLPTRFGDSNTWFRMTHLGQILPFGRCRDDGGSSRADASASLTRFAEISRPLVAKSRCRAIRCSIYLTRPEVTPRSGPILDGAAAALSLFLSRGAPRQAGNECSSPEPATFMGVFEVGARGTIRREELEPAVGLGRTRPLAAVGVDPIDAQPAAGKEFSA